MSTSAPPAQTLTNHGSELREVGGFDTVKTRKIGPALGCTSVDIETQAHCFAVRVSDQCGTEDSSRFRLRQQLRNRALGQ